jgi:hypothetical protein
LKIILTTDEARVFLAFIDIALRAKGSEALDAAALFKLKILQAEEAENREKSPPQVPPSGA